MDGPFTNPMTGEKYIDPHQPGVKLDAGKVRGQLVLGGFARALWEVCKVGTFGAQKYTPNGWKLLEIERIEDAKVRHWLQDGMGLELDEETEYLHAAHEAWGALARLDALCRKREQRVKDTLMEQVPEQKAR
jgi:hypothetical protein